MSYGNAAARRAIDPEHLPTDKQAAELRLLTSRLKQLAAVVDELNSTALQRAPTTAEPRACPTTLLDHIQ